MIHDIHATKAIAALILTTSAAFAQVEFIPPTVITTGSELIGFDHVQPIQPSDTYIEFIGEARRIDSTSLGSLTWSIYFDTEDGFRTHLIPATSDNPVVIGPDPVPLHFGPFTANGSYKRIGLDLGVLNFPTSIEVTGTFKHVSIPEVSSLSFSTMAAALVVGAFFYRRRSAAS